MKAKNLLLASVMLAAACGTETPMDQVLDPGGPQVDVQPTAPVTDVAGDPNSLAMAKTNGSMIGLGTSDTLQEASVLTDQLGQTHTHYNRAYSNLPVHGGDLVLHQKGGTFLGFSATLKTPVNVALQPKITAISATAEALRHYTGTAVLAKVSLVVHAFGDTPKLAYDVVIYNDEDKDDYSSIQHTYVDALTGAYLSRHNEVKEVATVGSGKSLYMGTLPLTANSLTSGFEMRDPSRGGGYTTNMNKMCAGML